LPDFLPTGTRLPHTGSTEHNVGDCEKYRLEKCFGFRTSASLFLNFIRPGMSKDAINMLSPGSRIHIVIIYGTVRVHSEKFWTWSAIFLTIFNVPV
jgi:hypothetical protein